MQPPTKTRRWDVMRKQKVSWGQAEMDTPKPHGTPWDMYDVPQALGCAWLEMW